MKTFTHIFSGKWKIYLKSVKIFMKFFKQCPSENVLNVHVKDCHMDEFDDKVEQ